MALSINGEGPMHAIHMSDWSWSPWRFLKSLLAVLVSLLLLAGAAIEAGRRLMPSDPVLNGRLVEEGSPRGGSA
jgi:hypothetical protein